MRKADAQMLAHGVYRIFWKSGGSSVAAVGSLYDGTRWLAPSNWTSAGEQTAFWTTSWRMVESAELIATK